MEMIFMRMRDDDSVHTRNHVSVYRLRKHVPLLAIRRAFEPRVSDEAHVACVNQQASVTDIFNSHIPPQLVAWVPRARCGAPYSQNSTDSTHDVTLPKK